jgi:hypothetical protein
VKILSNYSKILIQEIMRAARSRGSCRDPGGMRLSPEPELPDHLTGVCDRRTSSGPDEVARQRKLNLLVTFEDGPVFAPPARSKTFRVESNSYNDPNQIAVHFQSLRNGGFLALTENRRSGAQRGASENNFGQRFSVSTPCFISRLGWPSPNPRFLGNEIKTTI